MERQQLKEEIAAMASKFEEEKEELKETQRLEVEVREIFIMASIAFNSN